MKIIEEKISKQELHNMDNAVFRKSKDEDDLLVKELFAIGKRDCERFVAIRNFYLEHDY